MAELAGNVAAPCWELDNVSLAISVGAKVGQQPHYFLASHAPVSHIMGEKGLLGELDEVRLFDELMHKGRRNTLAVVAGEPGTGKSHLIHWLMLRCRHELAEGRLRDVVPVLIKRESGSLKDTLEQLVNQLGPSYHVHLNLVRNAIDHLEEADARRSLSLKLADVLGNKSLIKLPPHLRDLAAAPAQRGFGGWLCRDGGPIATAIALMTEASTVEERLNEHRFTAEDVQVTDRNYNHAGVNEGQVVSLINNLIEDDPARYTNRAVEILNQAMGLAIGQFTGLGTDALRKVLGKVRGQLKAQGKTLLVLVEDVSTLSILDTEVMLAFDPESSGGAADPCDMVAVLGMVTGAYKAVRENLKDRVSVAVSVGKEQTGRWRDDPAELDRFAARYLNAARLPEARVKEVAAGREGGDDVGYSACTDCPFRPDCHKTFGRVSFDGVDVGLYPFTPGTPHRLLNALEERENTNVRRNPRGLLLHVMAPVLRDRDALPTGKFPQVQLPVERRALTWWDSFEQKYLVAPGWNDGQKHRLKRLGERWVDVPSDTRDEAAALLEPLKRALGFPRFADGGVGVAGRPEYWPALLARYCGGWDEPQRQKLWPAVKGWLKAKGMEGAVAQIGPRLVELGLPPFEEPKQPPPPPEKSELERVLKLLDEWWENPGRDLAAGDEPLRKLLADFIRESFRWTDQTEVPPAVWRRLLFNINARPEGDEEDDVRRERPNRPYAFVDVAGMRGQVTHGFRVRFERDAETRQLIGALARHRYAAGRSWQFEGGEEFKRVIARWQRKLFPQLLRAMRPAGGLDPGKPLAAAVRFLSASAVAVRRSRLPDDPAAAQDAILHDPPPSAHAAAAGSGGAGGGDDRPFDPGWAAVAEQLRTGRRDEVRRFVTDEVDLPQGPTGGQIIINPAPLLRHARAFVRDVADVAVTALEPEYNTGFLQAHYMRLGAVRGAAPLAAALAAERAAAVGRAAKAVAALRGAGYDDADPAKAVERFYHDLQALTRVMKASAFEVPDPTFETLVRSAGFRLAVAGWGAAVAAGLKLESADAQDVIAFAPAALRRAGEALDVVGGYLELVQEELAKVEEGHKKTGDPHALRERLLAALAALSALSAEPPPPAGRGGGDGGGGGGVS